MIIAVDFDGTIVEHKYPEIGEERPYATEVLKMLIAERHKLVLWTMRTGDLLNEAIKWCSDRGVDFYAVNSENSDMFDEKRDERYSCKINADVFIDDKNVGGLPDWPTIYKIIHDNRSYEQILRRRVREQMVEAKPPVPNWMFWKKK